MAKIVNENDIGIENVVKKPKTVLHAVPGWGKTYLGAGIESCIFIKCEEGLDKIAETRGLKTARYPKFGVIKDWDSLQGIVRFLAKEQHNFKALVLDTLDALMPILEDYVVQNYFAGNKENAESYGKWVKYAHEELRKILIGFDFLVDKKDMEILILCHSKVDTFKNPTGEDWSRYTLKLPDSKNYSLNKLVCEWADNLFFGTYETIVKDGKAKGNEKVIFTSWEPGHEAKNRYNLPIKINNDWQNIKELMEKGLKHEVAETIG